MTHAITFSSQQVDVANPQLETLKTEDVAHSLSQTNRFSGHTVWPYNVAQHSIAVASIVRVLEPCGLMPPTSPRPTLVCAALIHDLPEYILGDPSRPMLAANPALASEWQGMAKKFDLIAAQKYGLRIPYSAEAYPAVKLADVIALELERRVFWPTIDPWCDELTLIKTKKLLSTLGISPYPQISCSFWQHFLVKADPTYWSRFYYDLLKDYEQPATIH